MIRFTKLPDNIEERIVALVPFLEREADVVFAYLFGGLAREEKRPFSDVDIALYMKDPGKVDVLGLLAKISNILGTEEIDLVVLNRAPISLSGRIVKGRRILVDKDPFLRHKYESLTLREFFDFEIKERAILQSRYAVG
jgi:uncharacterized protein